MLNFLTDTGVPAGAGMGSTIIMLVLMLPFQASGMHSALTSRLSTTTRTA